MRRLASAWTAVAGGVAPAGWLAACAVLALMLGPPAADGSAQPSAYTGEAAEVTFSSVTLKGSVYPGDEQTSYYFEYGPTSAYGAQTPSAVVVAGTQTIHVAAVVGGLSTGTTYHYRLVAVNGLGTKKGQDRAFKTKKIPLTFVVAATPSPDLSGSPFSIDGTLSGTGSANQAIVLEADAFPYLSGFADIGEPELTDAGGSFSFSVPSLSQNTELRVATLDPPSVRSRVVLERVAVRVVLHVRPTGRHRYVRLFGTVTPAQSGATVAFQLLRRGRRPLGAGRTVTNGPSGTFSRFSRVVRIHRVGLYRAFVYVVSGAQVSNHSRAILIG